MSSYREYAPSPELAPFVECFWTSEGSGSGHAVVPDGCVDFLFRPRSTTLVGAMTRPIWAPRSSAPIVAVRFRPGGAGPFLRAPLDEFTDAAPALEGNLGNSELRERLTEAGAGLNAVRVLERELIPILRREGSRDDQVVRNVVRWALSLQALPSVDRLVARSGYSSRQLERKFHRSVGLGPKTFLQVMRFHRARKQAESGRADWAGLAAEHGYSDQSHFVREFRRFAGATPARAMSEFFNTAPADPARFQIRGELT